MTQEKVIHDWEFEAEQLAHQGLYDPSEEHAACGVGLVTSIDGEPRRDVVTAAIEALKAVWHRGAVDADGKTGDGAGLHVQIPQSFFRAHIERTAHETADQKIAVGMVFLPRTDFAAQERCRVIVEREIIKFGYTIFGWRQVPVNTSIVGEKANMARPEIEQVMVSNRRGVSTTRFELDLFIIRRRIEKCVEEESIRGFYICSLSCRSIIYKGMFLAEQLSEFYPDSAGRALHLQLRHLPPALFDQHLPDLAFGPALPGAGAQRRDQHPEGQRQLDEGTRMPPLR